MALDQASCTSYRAIKADILLSLENGSWKTLKINIDGDEVQSTSISQLMDFLDKINALVDACDTNNTSLSNSQQGLRTTAWNNGSGLS